MLKFFVRVKQYTAIREKGGAVSSKTTLSTLRELFTATKKGRVQPDSTALHSPIMDWQTNSAQHAFIVSDSYHFRTLPIPEFLQFNLLRKCIVPHNPPHLVYIGKRVIIFIVMRNPISYNLLISS